MPPASHDTLNNSVIVFIPPHHPKTKDNIKKQLAIYVLNTNPLLASGHIERPRDHTEDWLQATC